MKNKHRLYKIAQAADKKVLTTPCATFPTDVDSLDSLKPFLTDLIAVHLERQGVGMAAPQIGESLPVFVIGISEEQALLRENGEAFALRAFINPSYEGVEDAGMEADLEGCFSVDSVAGWVPRYRNILFSGIEYDPQMEQFTILEKREFNGFVARVLQHETDHVHGILIKDRLTPDCEQGPVEEMLRLRRERLSPAKRAQLDQLLKKQNPHSEESS